METRYDYSGLRRFAKDLLCKAGMDAGIADVVAEVLLEGDLLGKTTHGLQLLGPYLQSAADGEMTLSGRPRVLKDAGSGLALDGDYLPGPYVVRQAIELATQKLKSSGVVAVNIRRSHHIGCLQAYLKPVTDRGHVILLMCSDPSVKTVAPHGGVRPVYTPNPLAVGIPTGHDPILIDISTSSTTNGESKRLRDAGKKFRFDCLQTAEGEPTNDPAVLFADPPGTILPLGGFDLGHKGFALAIMVEALTSALGGGGRSDQINRWGASVFLQLMDPEFFGGAKLFGRETDWFTQACRNAAENPNRAAVRMPGEKALALRRAQLNEGVVLHPTILPSLKNWAEKYELSSPQPLK